ncbi:MAG: radical SAM protein [Desulfobacterales bacterium]|nr:radical SAM protein [Desulfobacterales bacterium]
MTRVLLAQLPIPRQNFGRRTGNIPLGAACLKQAAQGLPGVTVEILPESEVSYLGDAALSARIAAARPDVIGFSVFSWNIERSLYAAEQLKAALPSTRIVFGGPEVTPDNPLVRSPHVDVRVCGEGEQVFRRLLTEPGAWGEGQAGGSAADIFRRARSPYVDGLLEPAVERLMLLETQRGCPYRCGFCYYNKSRRELIHAEPENLLDAVRWALTHDVEEVYLLDPSLNSRPDLRGLLAAIARLNSRKSLRFISEIRAEAIDAGLADQLAAAGFTWFEIGLQSTTPEALKIMNRPTRLDRFLRGVAHLKRRGITPGIDLIIGLPGDDLAGFMRSVDFVADHDLAADVQIFPLSVLPGTRFRQRRRELGLQFEPHPPYTVTATPSFSPEEFLLAYDYAETRLDTVFFPLPDLELSWRQGAGRDFRKASDLRVRLGERECVAKLVLNRARPVEEIRRLSRQLTQPYQVLAGPGWRDVGFLAKALQITTAENPFTPFEVVFFEPAEPPRPRELLNALNLRRPHFLDGDLRYLFPRPGNRAVLFTLVSVDRRAWFRGEMQRQVYWWKGRRMPSLQELADLGELDGVLIDSPLPAAAVRAWQDTLGPSAAEEFHIGFADVGLQIRWLLRICPDEYVPQVMQWKPA